MEEEYALSASSLKCSQSMHVEIARLLHLDPHSLSSRKDVDQHFHILMHILITMDTEHHLADVGEKLAATISRMYVRSVLHIPTRVADFVYHCNIITTFFSKFDKRRTKEKQKCNLLIF